MTWCHECGWNLRASTPAAAPRGAAARLADRAGARLGDRLLAELRRTQSLEPRLTVEKAAAYAIAALVHIVTVGLVAGAATLAALFTNAVSLVLAAAMVAFAWLVRPRFGKVPDEGRVDRDEAPTLYALADEVAAALAVRPVDAIIVDRHVNAYWSVAGIRRTRVLGIGMPLLVALRPQERVALVAHELAHARNGDVRRTFFVGSALNALVEMVGALLPGESLLTYSTLGALDLGARALLWLLAQPVKGLLLLEYHLLLRDMQRAEYLADALGARVAGTKAMVAAHEKLLLETTVSVAVQQAAQAHRDPFELIGDALGRVPERELDRVRRVAALERTKLGATHPPTAMRIELLESRAPLDAEIVLDAQRSRAIDDELAARRASLAHELAERYRASLYR